MCESFVNSVILIVINKPNQKPGLLLCNLSVFCGETVRRAGGHQPWEEKPWELGLVSLGKKQLQGDTKVAPRNLQGVYWEDGSGLFIELFYGGKGTMDINWKKQVLDKECNFHYENNEGKSYPESLEVFKTGQIRDHSDVGSVWPCFGQKTPQGPSCLGCPCDATNQPSLSHSQAEASHWMSPCAHWTMLLPPANKGSNPIAAGRLS